MYFEHVNSYDRSASYEYFNRNTDLESKNKGAAYMIGLAISLTINRYTRLEDDDMIVHLLLSRFVSNLIRNQRVELGFILELIKRSIPVSAHLEIPIVKIAQFQVGLIKYSQGYHLLKASLQKIFERSLLYATKHTTSCCDYNSRALLC